MPGGVPAPIVDKLNKAIVKIVSQPEFQKRHMFNRGLSPVLNTPKEFTETLIAEKRLGPEVVQASGLYPDLKF
jgi:tripartite-type tricarboxylate transporter receptor subunit TctC